jgi:hypothetical protein
MEIRAKPIGQTIAPTFSVRRATKTLLLLLTMTACAGIPASTLWAGQGHRDEGRGKGKEHRRGRDDDQDRRHESEDRYFRPGDRTVILNYYSGRRRLPPGLAKKLARGGSLPPGWEKRFHPMPVVIARQLPPVCATCSMGIVDGCAVVYDRRTRIIMDVLALAGDILQR